MSKKLLIFCLAALERMRLMAVSFCVAAAASSNKQARHTFVTAPKPSTKDPLRFSVGNLFLPLFKNAASVVGQWGLGLLNTQTQKNAKCKTYNFANYAGCCTAPGIPNYASSDAINICSNTQASQSYFKIFTTYYLNTFMNAKDQLVLNSQQVVSAFGPQICFAECVFSNEGWLFSNGSINYNLLTANVNAVAADKWDAALVEITKNCSTFVENNVGRINVNGKTCSAKPAVLAQCIRKSIYASCPAAAMVNNTHCVPLRRNIQNCDLFQMGSFSKKFG